MRHRLGDRPRRTGRTGHLLVLAPSVDMLVPAPVPGAERAGVAEAKEAER